MSIDKGELISASELSRRTNITPQAIYNRKKKGEFKGCMWGDKFYYNLACDVLGQDPLDTHKPIQSEIQDQYASSNKKLKKKKKKEKKIKIAIPETKEEQEKEAKSLLEQILITIKNPKSKLVEINNLKMKAGLLKDYFSAKNEEIKNTKLEDNLYEKEDVLKILTFATSTIRNALINLPNNYAVNLEGLSQKEIKEYVQDDINRILDDLYNTGDQFDE